VCLLASRFYIRQRRPDKFAIHNASSKRVKRKMPIPQVHLVECNKSSKPQAAAYRGEMRIDPLKIK